MSAGAAWEHFQSAVSGSDSSRWAALAIVAVFCMLWLGFALHAHKPGKPATPASARADNQGTKS